MRDVADQVLEGIDQLADSVRDLVVDPIVTLSEIVSDLMGGGPSSNIFERLTEVWNGLFGGNDDEAETTGSGTVPSVGPTAVAHACPRGDDLEGGHPMSLDVQIEWGPPAIDGRIFGSDANRNSDDEVALDSARVDAAGRMKAGCAGRSGDATTSRCVRTPAQIEATSIRNALTIRLLWSRALRKSRHRGLYGDGD